MKKLLTLLLAGAVVVVAALVLYVQISWLKYSAIKMNPPT